MPSQFNPFNLAPVDPVKRYQNDALRRFGELEAAREKPGASQDAIAPKEHGAFAESLVADNPFLWGPLLLGAIPAWTAGKAAGILPARSSASFDEMSEAYKGLGRGVAHRLMLALE